jgi:putative ABC transport system ATP-binding protein
MSGDLSAETTEGTTAEEPTVSESTAPEDEAPPLQLIGVTREYDGGGETVRALIDVDLTVEAGEFVAVVGPSGSGKSTMLNTLGLLDTPTSGEVLLDGRNVTTLDDEARTDLRKEYIGFVFQDYFLIPTLTATENVSLPTVYDRDRDATDRAEDLLERVGLGDRLRHRPTELSGGQKQRVAIARALINRPEVLLADEPTGNLDTDTGRQVLGEFERICGDGVAVVAVTHDELVTEYADRTVELIDGRLEER